MIKKIAWDAFKNTGDINTFLEFKQIQGIEKQIQTGQIQTGQIQTGQMEEQNGNNQNEWNNYIGK